MIDSLDKESSVAEFDMLQSIVDDTVGMESNEEAEKQVKRGAELRKLTDFFDEQDPDRNYGAIQRVCGTDGSALWTTVEGALMLQKMGTEWQIKKEVEKKTAELHENMSRMKEKLDTAKHLDASLNVPEAPAHAVK